jgi:DNA-binding GntR family transcriptional regulator
MDTIIAQWIQKQERGSDMWADAPEGNDGPRAFERVFRHVRDRIVEHRLSPGEPLYETGLAEELGLSRTPIRHALARLVSEGFLETRTDRRGYRIPLLDGEDLRELFVAREMLEGTAARLAAEEARREDIQRLRERNEEEIRASVEERMKEYVRLNDEFHFDLIRIGGNRYLERAFPPIYWRSQLYVLTLSRFHPLESPERGRERTGRNSPAEHARIIDAVERREPEEAERTAREHLRSTWAYRIAEEADPRLLSRFFGEEHRRGRAG